jgi:hypothetical protein
MAMRRSHSLVAAAAALGWCVLQWLRWPEPPGLDQSLFVTYGHWLRRGFVLYRDLWDSKPPGLFAVYALGEACAGARHAPRMLDAFVAAAAAACMGWLLRDRLAPRPVAPDDADQRFAARAALVGAVHRGLRLERSRFRRSHRRRPSGSLDGAAGAGCRRLGAP